MWASSSSSRSEGLEAMSRSTLASDERGGKGTVHVFGLRACFYDTMGGGSDTVIACI